ncbi:MAG: hypothetical protein JW839_05440 [Candidatus Lokiarchaeota archaeon]|nr:hypothetical protein [Candidatus Lokiarchaeota archaeon]
MRKDDYIKLWLMDRSVGICIFEQSFADMPKNLASDLVTGFFYAMLTFSNEIASQDVEFIQMQDIRIVFHGEGRLLFAMATTTDADHRLTDRLLRDLGCRFQDKYRGLIEQGCLNNTAVFEGFASEVEAEIGRKSTAVAFVQTQVDRFKVRYEGIKTDFNRLKKNLSSDAKSIMSPLVKLIGGQADSSKSKQLDTYRPSPSPCRKEGDD